MRPALALASAAAITIAISSCSSGYLESASDSVPQPLDSSAQPTPGPSLEVTPGDTEPSAQPTLSPDPSAVPPAVAQPQKPSNSSNAASRFGPTGKNWPALTPKPSDSFELVVNVPADWDAISGAIQSAPAGNVKILVEPGVFAPGNGANSTDLGVLSEVGNAARSSRILVMPRDGYGTVKGSGSILAGDAQGYSFVNMDGVSLVGFDFQDQTVAFRNSANSAFAWSTFGLLNVVGSKGTTKDFQLVEVVAPERDDFDGDRAAFRTGQGSSIQNVDVIGSYFAPVYKAGGSSAHSDTLQFSGSGPISDINIVDSVFFQSSSQIFMCEQLSYLQLRNTLMLADKGAARYTVVGDRHQMVLENTLWGGSSHSLAENSILIGSVGASHQFDSVKATRISKPTSASVSSGAFTVDNSPITKAWLDTVATYPTAEYLSSIWKL